MLKGAGFPGANKLYNETTQTGSYVILPTDNIIWSNNTSGAGVSYTLPATPSAGQFVWIKDVAGNAGTFNITIIGTVDGVVNPVIGSNYGGLTMKWNGSGWSVSA
jgi:hypothetical protein